MHYAMWYLQRQQKQLQPLFFRSIFLLTDTIMGLFQRLYYVLKDVLLCSSMLNGGSCVYKQAERELQPWIAKDDEEGQKMWKINQRIVKVMVELMRNHDRPESLVILASASDLLLRATDGMLVDGEACTLPQLEVIILYRYTPL